jgi:hypothetical protein
VIDSSADAQEKKTSPASNSNILQQKIFSPFKKRDITFIENLCLYGCAVLDLSNNKKVWRCNDSSRNIALLSTSLYFFYTNTGSKVSI